MQDTRVGAIGQNNHDARGNKPINERKTHAKKMKMWLKLSEKKHLDDQSKKLFQKLGKYLFSNQLLLNVCLCFVKFCFNNVCLSHSVLIMPVCHILL